MGLALLYLLLGLCADTLLIAGFAAISLVLRERHLRRRGRLLPPARVLALPPSSTQVPRGR